jgi:STE24 endopeptidase
MHTYTWIFIIPFVLSFAVQLWLSSRQSEHVKRFRSAVLKEFAGKISLKEHQKAADYTVTKGRFGRLELLLGAILLLVCSKH